MPRLFVAIDLPETTKDQVLTLRRYDLPPGRWARREAQHLSLHFIGDVPEAVARAHQRTLAQVEAPVFELRIAGVGQFPIEARPRRTRWKQLLRLVNQESPRSNLKLYVYSSKDPVFIR